MKGLYRGFCRDENGNEIIVLNGEEIKGFWAVGNYIHGFLQCIQKHEHTKNGTQRLGERCIVIPETVCEAVRGAFDKNGKQIYEGDILFNERYNDRQIVYYSTTHHSWRVRGKAPSGKKTEGKLYVANDDEIIGTIFDKEKNDANDC